MDPIARASAVVLLVLVLGPSRVSAEIAEVYHEPRAMNPTHGEVATIHFRASGTNRATVHIYDGRDIEVRSIEAKATATTGVYQARWDGRDSRGVTVPPEAYRYTVEARGADGVLAEWDVTESSGGEGLRVGDVAWDPASGKLSYSLPKAARVRARAGLSNGGPLLKTLLSWVPRAAGEHVEAWDGRGASGVLEIGEHKSLSFQVDAFALARNEILVMPEPSESRFAANIPEDARRREPLHRGPKRMYDYARQPMEKRRDFPVRLLLPDGTQTRGSDSFVVSGDLPIRLDLAPKDASVLAGDRFEAAFFVDGHLSFEAEVAFFPMTWTWRTKGVALGEHYITVNLRSYEGHFGMATIKVDLESSGSPVAGSLDWLLRQSSTTAAAETQAARDSCRGSSSLDAHEGSQPC